MATKVIKSTKAVPIPAGFRWSQEDAQKALAKHAFIRVGGKSTTYRYISGALRSWRNEKPEENSTLFNVQYRVTGTPEALTETFTYAGLTPAQITRALADSIGGANVQTEPFLSTYQQEIDTLTGHRKSSTTTKTQSTYSLAQLIALGDYVKEATIVRPTKPGKSTPTAGTLRGPSLKERLATLGADKVLDVSNMDRSTGKNVRSVARPKSSRGGKFLSQDIPIVSNNLDNLISAIELVYGVISGHQATISEAQKFFSFETVKPKKVKTPKGKKVKTPKAKVTKSAGLQQVPQASPVRQRSPVVNCPVPRVASPLTTRGVINLPSIATLRK
jgi:hypothetical protein